MKEKNNKNRIVAYFSTSSSSTSGGQLPSLLNTTTDVDSKVSSSSQQQQKKKRRQSHNIRRRQQRCSKVFEISKRLLVYGIALAAIASSVLSIFSCNFFSYTDSVVATDGVDGFTSALENDTNMNEVDLGYQYTPFEFMNEAGVGLFAYYMGDPSEEGSILYKQEPMCFLYCDELHDFYWFSNNYNPGNKRLLTRKIDLWIVARYCSIIAPSVALWGLLQLIAVENWFCGCRLNIVTHTATVTSSLVLFVTFLSAFLSASLIQFGTFSIMFASPNLSSPYQSEGTTYQDSFCFSTTTTSSNKYLCRIDTGGFYSLGSGLVYLVLAVYSSLSTYSTTTTTQSSATDDGNDDGPNNKNENTDDHNNTRSLVCCGGCCLRRGDGNSSSGTHSSSRKGGINNNNNNDDDDDQKVVSTNRKRVAVGDANEKSETSDSSSSSSTSTSQLISKLSYHDEEEHNDDEEEQHKDAAAEEEEVRSGGASFSFFGSEITF
eukprot:CAMPEP_0170884074 /NCGR_PEP_ID=MMETSP0734-20130129/34752_1 /TAXON_ID=186038 /ORGANISM="Fragilariopsis kerguelensis, Strain L26-C5" /LENGTH=488 /DNA_ID=CAMNT_0011268595 /DNA_START=186 /DNA_END=1652 /DNA_ORIENTATION=+